MNDCLTIFLTPKARAALSEVMREQAMDADLAIGMALPFYAAAMPHKPIDAAAPAREGGAAFTPDGMAALRRARRLCSLGEFTRAGELIDAAIADAAR